LVTGGIGYPARSHLAHCWASSRVPPWEPWLRLVASTSPRLTRTHMRQQRNRKARCRIVWQDGVRQRALKWPSLIAALPGMLAQLYSNSLRRTSVSGGCQRKNTSCPARPFGVQPSTAGKMPANGPRTRPANSIAALCRTAKPAKNAGRDWLLECVNSPRPTVESTTREWYGVAPVSAGPPASLHTGIRRGEKRGGPSGVCPTTWP